MTILQSTVTNPARAFGELHDMEIQIARCLPVLSGSVLNVRLRKFLWDRSLSARERRDWCEQTSRRVSVNSQKFKCMKMLRILTDGNRRLGYLVDPYQRDLAMVRHCLSMEQFEANFFTKTAELAVKLNMNAEASKLDGFRSELQVSKTRLLSIESELSRMVHLNSDWEKTRCGSPQHEAVPV